jgi:hypothetical protein
LASIPSKSFLTLFFLSLMILPLVGGVTPRAGVKTGDWAHYSVSQNMTGNKTLVKGLIAAYSPFANTSYVSLNITGVSGTNVSLTQGIHHTNGTIISSALTVDLSSGVDPSNPPVVIMQNYPNVLSGILNGTFLGVPRIFDNLVVSSGPDSNSSALRYSWDNSTGILLSKLFFYSIEANATNTATFTYTLAITSTSLWHYVPPKPPVSNPPAPFDLGFAGLYVSVGVVGALALGVVAYARRRPRDAKGAAKRRV